MRTHSNPAATPGFIAWVGGDMSEASAIPSWARVGAKVVCIRSSTTQHSNETGVSEGSIYTIREIVEFPAAFGVGLRFREISNPANNTFVGRIERAFWIDRFRPLVTDSEELGIEAQFYRAKSRKSKAPARESEPVE